MNRQRRFDPTSPLSRESHYKRMEPIPHPSFLECWEIPFPQNSKNSPWIPV